VSAPGEVHEERVRTLESLATLAGFLIGIPRLPDGRIPDVVRMCSRRRGVFLGEAKASEGPGDLEALTRLARYIAWWRQAGHHGPAILAVCCDQRDMMGWAAELTALAADFGIPIKASSKPLGQGDGLAWLDSA
jgi:hypothetical protein